MDWGGKVTYLGTTTLKEKSVTFGIKDNDRARHLCVLGRTGSGRGEFLAGMILQDVQRGLGVVVLDAGGNLAPLIMERLDPGMADRVIYIDPSDAEHPYSWNVLDDVRNLPEDVRFTRLMELIRSVYRLPDSPLATRGAELLLSRPDSTLITFYSLAMDERARKAFFDKDTEGLAAFEKILADSADVLKELEDRGRYVAKDTLVRNLLGQRESKFTLETVPEGAIAIVDFSKIRMFPTRMTPLVRVFVEVSRYAGLGAPSPVPLYLHDCLRYLGEEEIERAFTDHRVAITVADTAVQEADRERREKALARVGSVASFTAHPSDRALLERAFYPYIDPDELMRLEKGEFVIALTIDAIRSQPFFAHTLPTSERKNISYQDLIVNARGKYTTMRTKVDSIFRLPREQAGEGEDDDDDSDGSFSDAFRSMFAKKATGADTPPAEKIAPGSESAAESRAPAPRPTSAAAPAPATISEADLKAMLYVKPVAA